MRDPTSADAGKRKLQPLFVGPFPITKIMGPATYRIELPNHVKGHNVLNVSKLKLQTKMNWKEDMRSLQELSARMMTGMSYSEWRRFWI